MHWLRLVDADAASSLWRGTVFRFPASYPFEPVVDFMLVRHRMSPDKGLTVICVSGYNAGEIEVALPLDSVADGNPNAVSVGWMQDNWQKWLYPGCEVQNVFFRHRLDPTAHLPGIDE